jgi:L-ribulose-5-phosphate 3-epimerase
MERRNFVKDAGIASLGLGVFSTSLFKQKINSKLIGACDWSIGKNSDVNALDVAKAIGLNGVQINLGTKDNEMHLRKPEQQKLYKDRSKSTGVKIASLAIGELNNVPYKSEAVTDGWVYDSIDVAKSLDVEVILLAFFAKNDLRNDPKGMDIVIGKLKEVAPHAERNKKILGIESYLSAEEHLYIMDKVGSNNIKVYYDFRNATDAGNDIFKEMKLLGNDNICELHIKENGVLLGKGSLDWPRIFKTMNDLGFSKKKWSQLEWSLPDGMDVISGQKSNLSYVKNLIRLG